ncbi:MAG: HNH endonuclease [Proteobacteria bacterium]|nr:HNH endonuclease [Pseudomonadota bacterium]
MTSRLEVAQDVWYRVFTRDRFRCVYCGKRTLESLDTFAASHLDHLKPRACGGTDDEVNSVTACSVCNSIKGGYDPWPVGQVTIENRFAVLENARTYVRDKREGRREWSYVRDYRYWLAQSAKFQDESEGRKS